MKKYKLLKDLPGCKAGAIFTTIPDNCEYTPVGAAFPKMCLASINNTQWFEEVIEWPENWEELNIKTEWGPVSPSYLCVRISKHHKSFKSILARLKLEELAKEMNGDWNPDWSKDATLKYHVCRNRNTLSISDARHYAELIVFKTKEMAKFSLKHHKKLWEDYWMINK